MNAEIWKKIPPSGRDLDIYRYTRIADNSTRDAAEQWGLSQTRVVQIARRVEDYLSKIAPVRDKADEEDHRRQVWIAETIGAECVDYLRGEVIKLFNEARDSWIAPGAPGEPIQSNASVRCRYALTAARLAQIGSKIPASMLRQGAAGTHGHGVWRKAEEENLQQDGLWYVEKDEVSKAEAMAYQAVEGAVIDPQNLASRLEPVADVAAARIAVADEATAGLPMGWETLPGAIEADPPEVGCSQTGFEQPDLVLIEPVQNDASDLLADVCRASDLRSALRTEERAGAVQNEDLFRPTAPPTAPPRPSMSGDDGGALSLCDLSPPAESSREISGNAAEPPAIDGLGGAVGRRGASVPATLDDVQSAVSLSLGSREWTPTAMAVDLSSLQPKLAAAQKEGKLTEGAVNNIETWLREPRYAEYADRVAQHIEAGKWKELDDAFWTVIPFGTGGRRGKMYPIGCNAINDRTIGESAQGLAEYVLEQKLPKEKLTAAIAYDTRHNSRHFAELCASVLVANGFKVFMLDDYRSTPELSFLVRFKQCVCGIMVTASHNPPSDNAVKVYWAGGVQVVPPHDKGIIAKVMSVNQIQKADFKEAVAAGKVVLCTEETDTAFRQAVLAQRMPGPRDIKILYTPLHGVGESAVCPVLEADGFKDVEVYGPNREPNGDFPNVPGHVSNPENVHVFDLPVEHAKTTGADIVLATDPDCDRMGCSAPVTKNKQGEWKSFNGNQLGAILCDFVLEQKKKGGGLTKDNYIVTTLVTTQMLRRIATSYCVTTYDNLHVGFKWICSQIDAAGPDKFLFGTEESHGFLVGTHVRDKDGAIACMLMSELAATVKAAGKTLHEKMDSLYWQHGYHGDRVLNQVMPGSAGMAKMKALMTLLRRFPPATIGGIPVARVRDYLELTTTPVGKPPVKLEAPSSDMIVLDLKEEGNYIAVRPSGTEPKVKFYMFTYTPAEQLHNLETTKQEMEARMNAFEKDLKAIAEKV